MPVPVTDPENRPRCRYPTATHTWMLGNYIGAEGFGRIEQRASDECGPRFQLEM